MRPTPEQLKILDTRSGATTLGYNACVAVWRALDAASKASLRDDDTQLAGRARRYIDAKFQGALNSYAEAEADITYGIQAAVYAYRDKRRNPRAAPIPQLLAPNTFRVRIGSRGSDFTFGDAYLNAPGLGRVELDPFTPGVREYEIHPWSATARKARTHTGAERWVVRLAFTRDPFYDETISVADASAKVLYEVTAPVPASILEE